LHNPNLQLKCRCLTYRLDTGAIFDVWSGGGALKELTGIDRIRGRYSFSRKQAEENDFTPLPSVGESIDPGQYLGSVEEFYMPLDGREPTLIDLAKVETCRDAVNAHQAAVQAEADFVFEKGIKLFGSEQPTTAALRHTLKVQEMHTRDNPDRVADHDAILQTQTDLEALCKTCEDCCEQLLVTRDDAITFAEPES